MNNALHIAKNVITQEFLEKTIRGLLLIYDEKGKFIKLGWIESAEISYDKVITMIIALGPTIIQQFNQEQWEEKTSDTFYVIIGNSTTALEHVEGYHCTSSQLEHPAFKIYPSSSIPEKMKRSCSELIPYGEILK